VYDALQFLPLTRSSESSYSSTCGTIRQSTLRENQLTSSTVKHNGAATQILYAAGRDKNA
jgi:hypothetical protein